MNDEIMAYKARLEARSADKPIWEKKCLSIEEAAAYSGIGIIKLRQLCVSGQTKIFRLRRTK